MASIFLKQDDGSLVEMRQESYDSEALLQVLIAEHPDILAGDEVSPAEPRRWALVRREAGIPGAAEGDARWSLDHLLLDQDGIADRAFKLRFGRTSE